MKTKERGFYSQELAEQVQATFEVQKEAEYQLYGYATPSGKLYASGMDAVQAGEQRFVKVYVNKEDLK